jgi:hypothetical protein
MRFITYIVPSASAYVKDAFRQEAAAHSYSLRRREKSAISF